MKPTVLLFDAHAADQAYFTDRLGADFELVMFEEGITPELVKQAATAEVISMHVSSQVTAEIMGLLPQLKHVACRSTGFDNVDLSYAKDHNITVSTVPSYGDETVAEFAMMLMLAVSRKLVPTLNSVHTGVVNPTELTGHDLGGKTIGVIGTGKIGRRSIAIAKGFNMKVVAYDPFPNTDAAKELGYDYLPLDDVLAQADFLTLHAPATKDTEHLLDAAAFTNMKTGVVIVNTARGPLIDTPALIDALQSGKVAGAGLDVVEGEEFLQTAPELKLLDGSADDPKTRQVLAIDILAKLPNVLLTNHNAYNSAEALQRIRDTSAANISSWHAGTPQNLLQL